MTCLYCLAGLSISALSNIATALPIYEMRWAANDEVEYVQRDHDVQTPQQGFHAYDNWRPSEFGGNTNLALGTRFRMGGDEFADDLFMTTTGPALFTDFAFTIANTSQTQRLESVWLTNRIYDDNRVLLFADARRISISIAPESAIGIYSNSNVYTRYGVNLPPHIYVSMQFSDAIGVDSADVGCLLPGPRTTGYSTQFAYNFTTGQTLSFDGTDQTNMAFFVDTANVPLPGSAATLVAATSLALRRRR